MQRARTSASVAVNFLPCEQIMHVLVAPKINRRPEFNQRLSTASSAALPLSVRLGLLVRKLRRDEGLTQQQLSDRLGIDRCYLSEIENGRRSITLHIVEVLADGFSLTLPELFMRLE